MKRKVLTSVIFLFVMGASYAQNPLPVGKAQLNFGRWFR